MTASQIRQQFLDFFKSKGHTIVPSAPIVVKNDPTLLFTNAGMNQFKDYFLGNKTPDATRVADTQKCLRVSGKHNDLEEVGVDTYHHTMFEMLGNWSFGDYFKKEAIEWSWELLTNIYGIDKERLYVTVFEGDEKDGLPFDDEAYNEWKKWINEDRILKGNKKDNFWEMGDTGPCGPCSEIHIDCRNEEERNAINGASLVNADHPQVIEIWNNVFMQFNRQKDGSLHPLPAKHVDTGMGFERLVRVLQGKQSNYDTDIFTPTISIIEQLTDNKYDYSDTKQAIAFRVLADHIRAITFTVADGQLPASTGAGYVIRRILRRAVRYYYSYLDYKQPLLFQLIPQISAQFADVFPEVEAQKDFITKVIKEEEEGFLRTLEKGIKRFDDYFQNNKSTNTVDGSFAFELYDTYGFPLDLTTLMAKEVNATVDEAGFDIEMQQQKNRSRAATTIDAGDWTTVNDTDKITFVGYDDLNVTTDVVKYRKVQAKNKTQYQIVLNTTPFYAESGGQVGDKGVLIFDEEEIFVTDTKKENDLIIHITDKLPKNINAAVIAKVNWELRIETTLNHTATHLMHAALRTVLGTHVTQKGSLVTADYLRFDFSHFSKVTDEELQKVQKIINEKIRENIPIIIKEMPKEEALELGAMALFGEKYGDKVRVVIIDPEFSVELCGGTHLAHTGYIGLCTFVSESAVAAGVRRVEAITGGKAFQFIANKLSENKNIEFLLKSANPIKAVEKLLQDKNALEKQVEKLEGQIINSLRLELLTQKENITLNATDGSSHSIEFIGANVEVSSMDGIKKLCLDFKNDLKNYVAVITANINGKAVVGIGLSDAVVKNTSLDAGKIIKEVVAPIIKGGGGGQSTLATAGGQNVNALSDVIIAVRNLLG